MFGYSSSINSHSPRKSTGHSSSQPFVIPYREHSLIPSNSESDNALTDAQILIAASLHPDGCIRLFSHPSRGSLNPLAFKYSDSRLTTGEQSKSLPNVIGFLCDVSHPQKPNNASDAVNLSISSSFVCLKSRTAPQPPGCLTKPVAFILSMGAYPIQDFRLFCPRWAAGTMPEWNGVESNHT